MDSHTPGQSAYAHVRILSRSNTAGFKRRASALILTSSKCHSLRPAGRTSDFQFQWTTLRVFTLPSSLKQRCPHRRGYRGTPPFQLAQRKGKGRVDLSRNRQSFLTTSSARRQCNQPSTNVLMEIRRACLGHRVVLRTSGGRNRLSATHRSPSRSHNSARKQLQSPRSTPSVMEWS